MLKRILIANRGEIAMRIIRTAKQLNIETVLVYSSEDKDSKPVSFASKSICVGEANSIRSYLNQESILQTALSFDCQAIHPGYGFLSENASFAEKCQKQGLIFIGPTPEVIRLMGDKQSARRIMKEQGIPTVPGSDGLLESSEEAEKIAKHIGYPVVLKATAGGGGKGMRIAETEKELKEAFDAATVEATNAFGNGKLYLEKLIKNPRHIEVQILADNYGNIIHLGDRDCSLQRKNQKMVEESPAYNLDETIRKQMYEAALKAAKTVGYSNAGTVEFIVDQNGQFYFIEMNTRIQVEHPVTEMVTGIDIVREQLLIAAGKRLVLQQKDVSFTGAALECRINAEDPDRDFAPSPGVITQLQYPCGAGIRIESALRSGDKISPWYDSMIAKIIVHAETRTEAINKMNTALNEMKIEGVTTNLSFHKKIMESREYIKGTITTSFIDSFKNQY